eukprot:6206086-Pleurochrysis_carterae.AAC.2
MQQAGGAILKTDHKMPPARRDAAVRVLDSPLRKNLGASARLRRAEGQRRCAAPTRASGRPALASAAGAQCLYDQSRRRSSRAACLFTTCTHAQAN